MPKKKSVPAFLESEGFKEYASYKRRPEMVSTYLVSGAYKAGLSFEDAYQVMQTVDRPEAPTIKGACETLNVSYPKDFPNKKFSEAEIRQRQELSKRAEKTFYENHFIMHDINYGLEEYVEAGEISAGDAQSFKGSRDLLRCLLKFPRTEADKKENLNTLKKYFGYNLDKAKLSDAQYKDQLLKQQAEVINDKLRRIVNFDYSRFKSMTEEQLVDNWGEMYEFGYNMSTIKKELGGLFHTGNKPKPNPYVDDKLYSRFEDVDEDFGDLYFLDNCKMHAIINPYYATTDIDSALTIEDNPAVFEELSSDPYLAEMLGEFDSIRSSSMTTLGNQIAQEFNKSLNIKRYTDGVQFYDKKGNPLKDYQIVSKSINEGGIIAVPKDHAGMMAVFSYDPKTQKMTMPDPKPFQKTMNNLKAALRDIDAENAARDEHVEKNISIIGMMNKGGGDIFTNSSKIAIAVNNYGGDDPAKLEQFEKDTKDYLKRHYVTLRPQLKYDEFTKLINVSDKDKIGTEIINERRELSNRATEKLIDAELRRVQAGKMPQQIDALLEKLDINARVFKSVICKYGKENQASNLSRIKEFLDLDDNFVSKNTAPEILKTKRINILKERFKELDEIKAQLQTKSWGDQEIVDNIELLHEYGIAHGMEIRGFLTIMEQHCGIDTGKDLGINVSVFEDEGYEYNNIVRLRAAYIASSLYQYGAEETIFSDEAYAQLNTSQDLNARRSASSIFNVRVQNASTLKDKTLQAANINESQIDFVIDSDGKVLGNDLMAMGYSLSEKKEVRIYLKDKEEPLVMSCKDLYKIPVRMESRALSPEEKSITTMDRVEHKLNIIENNRKLSPEQKELASDLVESEYELGIITASLKGLEGQRLEENQASLKNHFVDYLAKLTISKMIEKQKPDADTIKGLVSDATIKGLKADLLKNGGIDELIANTNFEKFDPEKVWRDFTEIQKIKAAEKVAADKAANDIKYEKYKESIADSKARVNGIKNIVGLNEYAHWGLSKEACRQIKSATQMEKLTLDRASLQTISCALMLNEGQSIESIVGKSEEDYKLRSEYVQKATELVLNNKADEIGQNLLAGMDKINKILEPMLDNGKPFTVDDMLAPENANRMAMSTLLKDMFQETNNVSPYMANKLDANEKDKVSSINNAYSNVLGGTRASVNEVVKNVEKLQNKQLTPSQAYQSSVAAVLQHAVLNACQELYWSLPENENKPISELMDQDYFATQYSAFVTLPNNPTIRDIANRTFTDPEYAQKALISLLDGSFEKALNLKIELGPKGINAPDEYTITIDDEGLKKCVEERFITEPEKVMGKQKEAGQKEAVEAQGPKLAH